MNTALSEMIRSLAALILPDREMDLQVAKALGHCDPDAWYDAADDCLYWDEPREYGSTTVSERLGDNLQHYTSSLDDLRGAVPPGLSWTLGQNVHHGYWQASLNRVGADGAPECFSCSDACQTPEAALLQAILRTRVTKGTTS